MFICIYKYSQVGTGSESHSVMSDSVVPWTVHGILQARILKWIAFPFSTDLPNPGIEPRCPTLQADLSPAEPQRSARILEWVIYPFSRGSSQPSNRTEVSCIAGVFFTNWDIKETHPNWIYIQIHTNDLKHLSFKLLVFQIVWNTFHPL